MNKAHLQRINEVLFHIHQDISQPLLASELASIAAYSEQHFHRIFKDVVGESIHQYIRRVRMEYAANQLMFDTETTIIDIANRCGFQSASSFNKAFKDVFAVAPSSWRKNDLATQDKPYLKDPEIAKGYEKVASMPLPKPQILEAPPRTVAYLRHLGYNRSIRDTWMTLEHWAKSEQRDITSQFGLHHSNPAWVSLEKCRYVACITIDKPVARHSVVSQLVIPSGLHAVFRLNGKYGELLPQISQILENWLPTSRFKLRSTPGYVHYFKNHFMREDEVFELDFYLPISFF